MSLKSCVVDKKAKTLTLVMDLEQPKASASGKTMVIATTRGNQPTTAEFDGHVIVAGVNCYFKP
jgi:hypothetical protein